MISKEFDLPCEKLLVLNKILNSIGRGFIKKDNPKFIFLELWIEHFNKSCGEQFLGKYLEKVREFSNENIAYKFESILNNWNFSDYLKDKKNSKSL